MQVISTQRIWWSKSRTHSRLVILSILLGILAGCAGGKVKPQSVEESLPAAAESAQMPATPAGPSVVRLTDGRDGFLITEIPSMDTESRKEFERAVVLMKEQDYGEAIGVLEKLIERLPGVTAPYINLAIAYKHLDKFEPAEQHLKTALSLVPEHPVASNEYGLLLRQTGRFAEARGMYEKTLAAFPDYHPARKNLAILCDLYLKDLACAIDNYVIYSEATPQDEQVKIWIADLRARSGR